LGRSFRSTATLCCIGTLTRGCFTSGSDGTPESRKREQRPRWQRSGQEKVRTLPCFGSFVCDCNTLGGLNRPNLVRVDQGKEPRHFLRLFRGNMLVFAGERGAQNSRRFCDLVVNMLLFDSFCRSVFQQVSVSLSRNVRRGHAHVRMSGCRRSLSQQRRCFYPQHERQPVIAFCFVLCYVFALLFCLFARYLWIGEHANSHLRAVATRTCGLVRGPDRAEHKTEREGSESSKFVEAIGAISGHAEHETRPNNLPVKFFICSNANKQYRADLTPFFVQSDLSHSHQAILDRYSEVLVWLGRDTKPEDKKIALELAVDYVAKANDGRKNCQVLVIDEGNSFFSSFFFFLFECD
jgi:hypothetical protein